MAGGALWTPVLAAKSLGDSEDHEALLREQEVRIAEREQLISTLVARIERLERQVVALNARTATPSPLDEAALERVSAGQSGRASATASPSGATARDTSRATSATPSRPAASGPGQFAVDPEAAERALERTLVQSGALLLPWRKAEIDLSYSYQRRESTSPLLVRLGDDLVLANQHRERNLSTVRADLRIGLPNEWQLEFGLPYSLAEEDRLADLGANGRVFDKAEGRGLGDFSIALARTLSRERGWRPDLIARLTYDSGSGGNTGALALNDGIEQFSAELVALKRQDPLAFVLSGFYQISGEENGIAPGDQWGLSASTLLAASPDTSLRFGISHSVRRALELDGQSIAGSDEVIGLLNIGLSAILAPGIMLNLTAGLGLSDDAPDYYVQLSLPIRFDW
ncbi:MAG: hypothetical protein JXM75_10380 [Chromatiaceae bacterium]|nr:hypothetical protein [Chromatiaceae bacterium]